MKRTTIRFYYSLCLFFLIIAALSPKSAVGQVDFREETIYFLMTTRFFDGDPSNNVPNEWSSYNPDPSINPEITDPNDVTWRGDFKGLIEKLDYIQDLGFTAIWITPVVQNRSPLDYHGYHAWDFTKVDPRLESPGATFQDLINEVHARNMKIVLDIVTNHPGRFGIKNHAEIKYNTDPTQPWGKDSNGNPLQPNPNWEYDGITPNPDDGKIWSRANIAPLPEPWNQNLSNYNWPSTVSYVETTDPDWFHHVGNGFAQGFDDTLNLYYKALHEDTPDLATGSTAVRNYLLDAYRTFIEMGVDGFRWDTIKHMPRRDVLWFLDEFKKINPDLFIFGEVAQLRHELHPVEEINPHWYTWRGEVQNSEPSGMSVLDFYAMGTFHLFERGEPISGVTAAARFDHLYADPSELVTFLDNHDFGPNNDWNRRFGNDAANLAAAMNFMFTWRGIPAVYYGTEMQFMRGAFADIQFGGHQRSINLTGRAYYGDAMDQAQDHPIYKQIQKLNAIRSAVPALQKGEWEWGGNGGAFGVGYVRQYEESVAIVGLAKDQLVSFNFQDVPNGTYRDAVTGHEVSVSGNQLQFDVAPSSAGIYVLDGPGLIGQLGAGFFQLDAAGNQNDVDTGGGSGGGGNGGSSSSTIWWEPAAPTVNDPVTIFADRQIQGATLHWGVDGWNQPPSVYWPESSTLWQGSGPALRSPFTELEETVHSITIGPFNNSEASVQQVNFVVNYSDGMWDNNQQNDYAIPISLATSADGNNSERPERTELMQNFPNPFNPATIIQFRLEQGAHVTLTIYDATGREVHRLVNGVRSAGIHQVSFDAGSLASGLYFYRLQADGIVHTRKMTLIK
ncbi:MAG: alpha-amylase family glycosyl hydrolase [Balneolaceae bacterium]